MSRNQRAMGLFFIALTLFFVCGKALMMYTDWLWFASQHYGAVYLTILKVRTLLFAVGTVVFLVVLYPTCIWARRVGQSVPVPIAARLIPIDDKIMIDRYIDKVIKAGCVLVAIVAGLITSGRWMLYVKFLQGGSFGVKDPLFHLDIGFYVFRLPFIQFVWQSLFIAVILAGIAAGLIYVYDDAIQLSGERASIHPRVVGHASLLAGILFLLKSFGYRLSIFDLLFSSRGVTYGASYTDIHAYLPVYRLMVLLAIIAGIAMIANVNRHSMKWFIIPPIGMTIVSAIGLSLFPGTIQRVVVTPNEIDKERPYIRRTIEYTRRAFGLDHITARTHQARNNLTMGDIQANATTVQNIRLWDAAPLFETYTQLQGIRPYYAFADVDADRYILDGTPRQVMLAVRELSPSRIPSGTWVNRHLKYTHGYGLCLNTVTEATGEGQPVLHVRDIPPVSDYDTLRITRPEVYYGENPDASDLRLAQTSATDDSTPPPGFPPGMGQPGPGNTPGTGPSAQPQQPSAPSLPALLAQRSAQSANEEPAWDDYAIVNTKTEEFDYSLGNNNVMTRYHGTGGVHIDSFFKRFAFAWRFSSLKILLTTYLQPASRIQFNRRIEQRVRTIAPFLMYDRDPYSVIFNGRIIWILDAYTTTNRYPYSEPSRFLGNYIRNSVKVTVDAYNGTVTFYAVDPHEPILAAYSRVFPGMFKPLATMPAGLRQHLRYPRGMFMVQAMKYTLYHMDDVEVFYNKEDLWDLPEETVGDTEQPVEAYYLIMKPPGAKREGFLLVLPFTPHGKDNMIAWLCARCDNPGYGELTIYKFPKQKLVYGPRQIEARINQNPDISQSLTLWNQQGSAVIRGNLLVIPIEDSLIYVEPLYLQAKQSQLPELKRVIVAYADQVVMADRLDTALNRIFGDTTGPSVAEQHAAGAVSAPAAPQPVKSVRDLAAEAQQHFDNANELRSNGDWQGYGRELGALQQILKELKAASGKAPAATQRNAK